MEDKIYRKYIDYSFMSRLIFKTQMAENLGEWERKHEEVMGRHCHYVGVNLYVLVSGQKRVSVAVNTLS